jgi:hypothetical protein
MQSLSNKTDTMRASLCAIFLTISALFLAACGSTPAQSDISGTPTTEAIIAPTDIPTVPLPVGTGVSNLPIPVPTTPVGPSPTTVRRSENATGDSPEAKAIVESWQQAIQDLKSLSGKQEIWQLAQDGTRLPMGSSLMDFNTTDERYDFTERDLQKFRFRFVGYSGDNVLTAIFDGRGDYVTFSKLGGEVYRTLPEERTYTSFGMDDLGYRTIAAFMSPLQDQTYSIVGREVIEGRSTVELSIPSPTYNVDLYKLRRIFIDETTHLPIREVIKPTEDTGPGYESTIKDLQVNQPISTDEIRERLPAPQDVATIFRLHYGGNGTLPVYPSLYDEQLKPGFTLFAPRNGAQNEVRTVALIDKDGNRTPLLALEHESIIEGAYLPKAYIYSSDIIPRDLIVEPTATSIEIDNQPATLYTNEQWANTVYIRFQREGTWIQVRGDTKEKAIELASSLQPIHP